MITDAGEKWILRGMLYDAFRAGWMAGLDESTSEITLFNEWYDTYFKENNEKEEGR